MKIFDLFKKIAGKDDSRGSDNEVANLNNGNSPINQFAANTFNGLSGLMEIVIPYFDVFDSRFPTCGIPVSVQAAISYTIDDLSRYQSLSKTTDISTQSIEEKLKPILFQYVKNAVSGVPSQLNIPVDQLSQHLLDIGNYAYSQIASLIQNLYGVVVNTIAITTINIDTESDNYQHLKSLTSDMDDEKRIFLHETEMSNMHLQREFDQGNFRLQNESQQEQFRTKSQLELDAMKREHELDLGGREKMQDIQLENQQESMRIQREEKQRASKLQTEHTFFDAHDLNTKLAHEQKMEKLHILEKEVMAMTKDTKSATASDTPKKPKVEGFYMAKNETEYIGPFNWEQLQGFVIQGSLTSQTLVWRANMPEWKTAGSVEELSDLFSAGK